MAKKASKKWYESATLWTNLTAAVGTYAAYTQGQIDKPTAITAVIMAAMNMVLRTKTDAPLGS